MRTTTIIHATYHVQGMKRPEPVWDHFYYDPTTMSLERIREQAAAAKHSVIIHYHKFRAVCDNTSEHEYYGDQNLE